MRRAPPSRRYGRYGRYIRGQRAPGRRMRRAAPSRRYGRYVRGGQRAPGRRMRRVARNRHYGSCRAPSWRALGNDASSVNARGARGQFRQRARGTWQFQELGNKACVVLWGLGGGRGVGVGWWGWVVGGGRGRRWVVGVGVLVGSGRWVLGMGPWALLGGGTRRLAPPAVTVM